MIRSSRSIGGRWRARRLALLALPLAGIALLAINGIVAVRALRPRTYRVSMLTDVMPMPAMMARRIAANAGRHGLVVDLESRPVTSLEAFDLIDRPNPIDVALVPGGVAEREYPNVREVAELAPDSMHLMARAKLADKGLPGLRGKRIDLGPLRSVGNALARDLLSFAGLGAPRPGSQGGDYVAESRAPIELERALARLHGLAGADRDRAMAALSDAVFLLAPLPASLPRELAATAGYRLVPLAFADAYCLGRLNPTSLGDVTIKRSILEPYEVPAYTYGIDPAVPAVPCRTVATRLIVVASAPTDPEAISRLLETIHDGHLAGLLDANPLRGLVPIFPLHKGAEVYTRRNEPFFTPKWLSNVGKLAGGLGVFASGMVAFYGFLRLRQLRRFESYYQELRRLKLVARGCEDDLAAPLETPSRRVYLEDRLLDLKSQALRDFAEGGLKGEGLISGIISLVNDTRRSIDRIGRMP
jgi:TRAP-type uncharacterized transport system substrate-binding protein